MATKPRNGERSGTRRQCVNKQESEQHDCEPLAGNGSCSSANLNSSCCTVWIFLSSILSTVSCKLSIFKATFESKLACTSSWPLGSVEWRKAQLLVAPCPWGDEVSIRAMELCRGQCCWDSAPNSSTIAPGFWPWPRGRGHLVGGEEQKGKAGLLDSHGALEDPLTAEKLSAKLRASSSYRNIHLASKNISVLTTARYGSH